MDLCGLKTYKDQIRQSCRRYGDISKADGKISKSLAQRELDERVLQLATAFESLGHRHLVSILNIASGGDTSGDPRYFDAGLFHHVGDVNRGRFALDRWIGGDDKLIHLALVDTA